MMKPFLITVMAGIALVAAACGSSSPSSPGATTTTSAPGAYGPAPSATYATSATSASSALDAKSGSLGTVLVDGKGMTLYMWKKDKAGHSSCYGACASAWPPFLSSQRPKAGQGVKAALIGLTTRTDGKTQVTYHGVALYYFAGDTSPGDTNGQGNPGFGAPWYVVGASTGAPLTGH
jgi:predicted lipoprotein with Yx(FWY)xxD motif